MLTKRKAQIFKAIVEEFIATAEPVGSKTLLDKYNITYSSATVRSEMNELEKLGLLEKTHTSSGRIPSTAGYRFYVENYMETTVDKEFAMVVRSILEDSKAYETEEVIKRSVDILSQMTNLTSLVLGPDANSQRLEHIKVFPMDTHKAVVVFITDSGHTENKVFHFDDDVSIANIEACCDILNDRLKGTLVREVVDKMEAIEPLIASSIERHEILFNAFVEAFVKFASDNVYFSGQSNILYQPDFADLDKIKKLMRMLENNQIWRDIGDGKAEMVLKTSETSQLVWVNDLAIVSSKFKINDEEEGQLMVMGPSRMDYDRIVSLIEYLASCIEEIYYEGGNDEEKE